MDVAFHIIEFVRKNFKDLFQIVSVNLLGVITSAKIEPILNFFDLANGLFIRTEAIWKALPLIATFIYTIIKIRNESKKSNSSSSNNIK